MKSMPDEDGNDSKTHPLVVTAVDCGKGLTVYCSICNQTSLIEEGHLDSLITYPGPDCKTHLKINPFITKII